jgi:hypothetical protein
MSKVVRYFILAKFLIDFGAIFFDLLLPERTDFNSNMPLLHPITFFAHS